MIRKSNFVKTSSFKISDDRTPTTSLIEQTYILKRSYSMHKDHTFVGLESGDC